MDRAELLDKIRRIDENAFFSGTVEQGVRANKENILFQRDLEARRCVQYDRETA